MGTKNKIFVVIGSIALVATAGLGGAYLFANEDSNESAGSTTTSTAASSAGLATTPTSATTSSGYKDGTYTASTNYSVPHGETNSISATVAIVDGKITSVTANNSSSDRESQMWISDFESSLSDAVVGHSLDTTSYSRIGGASLTTSAFDDVLDQIATQASA